MKQAGTWKFVGNSSNAEKLTKWVLDNVDEVNKETSTWFNDEGVFSKKWYTILHPDGTHWIVATPGEAATIKSERPELKTIQPKVHATYKDAWTYVLANKDIFTDAGRTSS